MKLTFNVSAENAIIIAECIASQIVYAHDAKYNDLDATTKIAILHQVQDVIPQVAQEATNDKATSLLKALYDLSSTIDSRLERVRNNE